MYDFLVKKIKLRYAKIIMATWYAFLIILIILLFNYVDKADFLYLHL